MAFWEIYDDPRGIIRQNPPPDEAAHWPTMMWPSQAGQRYSAGSDHLLYLAWCTGKLWREIVGTPVPPWTPWEWGSTWRSSTTFPVPAMRSR